MTRFIPIALLLLITACEVAIEHQDAQPLADELLAADKAFADLSQRTDPKQAFAAYLAPNAIMIPRAGDPITGFDRAIASFGDTPGFELLWQPQQAEVASSGDMGWTWGRYQVLVDGTQVSNGKYVNIWVRPEGGEWKVRLDMGNQEPE